MLDESKIDVKRTDFFNKADSLNENRFDFEKIEGMLLGLAMGDALGITTEGMLPEKRKAVYGEIKDYLPNEYCDKPIGFPSDDTQLSFWTLKEINKDKGFVSDHVASAFCRGRIFGIGNTVRQFINNYKNNGRSWYDVDNEAGVKSAGNGALMRIAPIIILHLKDAANLWFDTALCTMITHNDSAAISSSIAFVNILWNLLEMDTPPDPMWWVETYVSIAKELEVDNTYKPRMGKYFSNYEGTIWNFVQEKVPYAYEKGLSVVEANELWGSGAYLLETVPMVLYILMKYSDNLEEAVVRAVNDTKDNDTIGSIVGAAVGALHGKKALPERWIKNLFERTTINNDGKIFEDI